MFVKETFAKLTVALSEYERYYLFCFLTETTDYDSRILTERY